MHHHTHTRSTDSEDEPYRHRNWGPDCGKFLAAQTRRQHLAKADPLVARSSGSEDSMNQILKPGSLVELVAKPRSTPRSARPRSDAARHRYSHEHSCTRLAPSISPEPMDEDVDTDDHDNDILDVLSDAESEFAQQHVPRPEDEDRHNFDESIDWDPNLSPEDTMLVWRCWGQRSKRSGMRFGRCTATKEQDFLGESWVLSCREFYN
ncbi:hypothetical protein MKEN_00563900 [Mycena kentingensis (nom. inval.)]|nr:hypothetical protein MKEN_00563900 [Mycena kentingensis (nom. inval.)]